MGEYGFSLRILGLSELIHSLADDLCVCVCFSILGWGLTADNTYLCSSVNSLKAVCKVHSEFNFLESLNSLQMWRFLSLFLKDWRAGLKNEKTLKF